MSLDDIPDVQMPDPPKFGWVFDPRKLTLGERDKVMQLVGGEFSTNPFLFMAYTAVAYARRIDPARYPWEIARDFDSYAFAQAAKDIAASIAAAADGEVQLTDAEAKEHEEAVAAAIEEGEPAPDPA